MPVLYEEVIIHSLKPSNYGYTMLILLDHVRAQRTLKSPEVMKGSHTVSNIYMYICIYI